PLRLLSLLSPSPYSLLPTLPSPPCALPLPLHAALPISDPYILGVSGGAALGGTLFLTIGSVTVGAWVIGVPAAAFVGALGALGLDRKSTRLNSSHVSTSYAGFCPNRTKE